MSTTIQPTPEPAEQFELENGDHMSQPEFHRAYLQTREDFKAELIEGIVYVSSPLKARHGRNHLPLGTVFFLYASQTPGVKCYDNTTVILGAKAEPQPDLLMRISSQCGGRSILTDDDFIEGPPEFIAEIASSSQALDLNAKPTTYAHHGVLEYLVVNVRDRRLHWFDLQTGTELAVDANGVCRIHTFPGLWIHAEALLAQDSKQMLATLDAGLASNEHAEFVQQLANARQR
jgi:Uma2 family endonuclease